MMPKSFQTQKEGQCFERKSIRMEPKALAVPLVAFANADGGTIVVGVNDAGEVEGVDGFDRQVNELLRVPFDFCKPTVKIEFDLAACTDRKGHPNRVLVLKVHQSQSVHATQADEVYYRVGDRSKKLTFDERMQLMYDKGDRFYEDTPVAGATLADLDLAFVRQYARLIGYSKTPLQYLKENSGFVKTGKGADQVSAAAILLFGKAPQQYFPRARIRFIRYEGTQEKTGTRMNVVKDVAFEGTVLEMTRKAIAFVSTQIKEHTYLGKAGLFVTDAQYPEFVRQEIVVNAVAHRDYSIKGTDIQIKMFDDRLAVESPGTLPGLVRLNTMRNVHFSRNPKIAAFLKDYGYVKEFGEGVDRMCAELTGLGLPEPEYEAVSFMLRCTVRAAEVRELAAGAVGSERETPGAAGKTARNDREISKEKSREKSGEKNSDRLLAHIRQKATVTTEELAITLELSRAGVEKIIRNLKKAGLLSRIGPDKGGHWEVAGVAKEETREEYGTVTARPLI